MDVPIYRALDLTNWEDAFLRLWNVLGYLTDTGYSRYDVTIKRVSFLYGGDKYVREVLRHLRDYRNRYVHASSENPNIETCLYQLKTFVEALIEFHLTNQYGFKSLKEAGQFLDLPYERAVLLERKNQIMYAQKFFKYVN